jgi:cobalt-zinc-cadmium efflux system protein
LRHIQFAIALNLSFAVLEFGGAYLSQSTAILSDAIHDLGDTLVFVLAWIFQWAATRRSSKTFTYGMRRLSLASSLSTGAVLLMGSLVAIYLATQRLQDPVLPQADWMLGFGIIGILGNGLGAYYLHRGQTLNEKMLSWHFLEDVLGWVAIVIGAIFIKQYNWPLLDPILAISISGFVLFGVFRHIRQSAALFLQASPSGLDQDLIAKSMLSIPGVVALHDLHLWSLDGQHHVMTLHLVIAPDLDLAAALAIRARAYQLAAEFGDIHLTCDLEREGDDCTFHLKPC